MKSESLEGVYRRRDSRLYRTLRPPNPFVMNADELVIDAPLGRWNLYIGGAGTRVDGYVNLDLFALPGVDVAANAEELPFPSGLFQRVECDAVLEHVEDPALVMREIERVLAPGGFAHVVVPFCHPFHEYPRDFRRYTSDGLRQLAGTLHVVKEGWRTGPTATLLVFVLEYVKLWLPWRPLRAAVHGILGWLLFPLRYLDLLLFENPRARQLGNHAYIWMRKGIDAD